MSHDNANGFRTFSENTLSRKHLKDLRESGLSDKTIRRCGFYTEYDTEKVRRDLGWSSVDRLETMGPFLAIPYFDSAGRPTDYTRYKSDNPRSYTPDDGKRKPVKYEAPRKKPTRPYFTPWTQAAIREPGADLFITEGEKKAAKAGQEGFPSIGLPGVTNWSKPRSKDKNGKAKGKRELHDDLDAIDWKGRRVFIVFDTDRRRNPDVARESAELTRVLERHGAIVHVILIPPRYDKKKFVKQGFDDFLVEFGRRRFRKLLNSCLSVPETVTLADYRAMTEEFYRNHIRPGCYIDRAPTGTGKTTSNVRYASNVSRAIFLVPSHKQEDDLISTGKEHGLAIVPYPVRSNETCFKFKEVLELEEQGFNPSEILCAKCPHRPRKKKSENKPNSNPCYYYLGYENAENASYASATHERFRLAGGGLLKKRSFVSVQEDAIAMQAPVVKVRGGFKKVAHLARWAQLNAEGTCFWDDLDLVAHYFYQIISGAEKTDTLPPHVFDWTYRHANSLIYQMVQWRDQCLGVSSSRHLYRHGVSRKLRPPINYVPPELRGNFNPDAIRFITLAMSGRLSRVYLRVIETHKSEKIVELVGVLKVNTPENAVMVFGDATADSRHVPPEFKGRLKDITPTEMPERLKEIIQYPVDITRSTTRERFVGIVRELLRRYPQAQRIGIVTHGSLEPYLDMEKGLLTPDERGRIVKVAHFFGTESRGSNSWKAECDALFVLGTPRQPEEMVQLRLLQWDNLEAAQRSGDWSSVDYWSGRNQHGDRETVRTRGYRDHDWYAAYRQLVHAELIQSVGRARPYNPDGVPLTVVVCPEDLGFPLADEPLELLNRKQLEKALPIYAALLEIEVPMRPASDDRDVQCEWSKSAFEKLVADSPYIYSYKKNPPLAPKRASQPASATLTGVKLARLLDMSPYTIRDHLAALEQFGLLTRRGPRSGFYVSESDFKYFQAVGKKVLTTSSEKPALSTRGHFGASRPVPSFWKPGMKFAESGRFSLHILTTPVDPERLRHVPDVLMAAVHDGRSTYLLKPNRLESFLNEHRNRTLITYDIGGTYSAVDDTMGNNGKIYRFIKTRRYRGIHLSGRLLDLAVNDRPEPFDSMEALAECLDLEKCRTLLANSTMLDQVDSTNRITDLHLQSLADHAETLYILDTKLKKGNDKVYDETLDDLPFGLPEQEGWLSDAWDRYGDLTHDIQARAEIVLEQVSRNGLAVDRDRVNSLRSRKRKELADLIDSMQEYGYKSDEVDDREARRILGRIECRYHVRFERNGDGNISVSKKKLACHADRFSFIEMYLDAGKRNRDLAILKKLDESRIHPTFDTLIKTGRVSSGGAFPIQAVPKAGGIRECFVPSPGHVFVTTDLVGAELGTLAQIVLSLYGKSNLADLINSGEDIHTVVASWIFDKEPDDVTKNERHQAKVLNIGIPGGIQVEGLRKNAWEEHGIGWSEDEAEELIRSWKEMFPEVGRYLLYHCEESNGVCTLTGRVRPKLDYNQARNTLFQGLAADGMKLALWNLHRAGYKIANTIHDEVLIEVPIADDYTDAVTDIESLIVAGMKEVTPDIMVRVKSSVSTRWSKNAELVRDRKGRIIAWTDEEDRPNISRRVFVPKKPRIIHAKGRPMTFDDIESRSDTMARAGQ